MRKAHNRLSAIIRPNDLAFLGWRWTELEKMAKKRGLALLETRELFRIVCAKLGGTKFPLEKICEDLSTDGEVHFRL